MHAPCFILSALLTIRMVILSVLGLGLGLRARSARMRAYACTTACTGIGLQVGFFGLRLRLTEVASEASRPK